MLRHIAVKNAPPIMSNDEEAIENSEGQRLNQTLALPATSIDSRICSETSFTDPGE
jgi:hypothetical protein